MKKILLIILPFIFSLNTNAQTIPNGGFENWVNDTETFHTYLVPQGWLTMDVIYSTYYTDTVHSVVKTTQSHSGQYALLLQTAVDSTGMKVAGEIFSCTSLNNLNSNFYGFPYSLRPATLQGFDKLTSVNGDVGIISFLFTKWNTVNNKRDTLCHGAYQTSGATASYAQFSLPLTYSLNEFPDTASIHFAIQAVPYGYTHLGTQFYIDDISFIGSVPFGVEAYTENDKISIYPNPSIGNIVITASQNIDEIKVTDVLGQLIYTDKPNSQKLNLQIENIGVYFVTITSGNKNITQKLIVNH